jgi:hypothetical protein
VLDAVREELRKRDYLPILFDFEVPTTRDITETVSLLARMARFVVADLTNPSSIPKELEAIVPSLAVPVQRLLEGASRPWGLPVFRYEGNLNSANAQTPGRPPGEGSSARAGVLQGRRVRPNWRGRAH